MAGQYHCIVSQGGVRRSHSVRDSLHTAMRQASYAHIVYYQVSSERVTTDVGMCPPTCPGRKFAAIPTSPS